MFTAALFIRAKKRKQCKFTSTDEWVNEINVPIQQNTIQQQKEIEH